MFLRFKWGFVSSCAVWSSMGLLHYTEDIQGMVTYNWIEVVL